MLPIKTYPRAILKALTLLTQKHPPKYIHKQIPYFAQWESVELAKDILEKRLAARNDPQWQKSGAESAQEYEMWSWNACGMACLKMALAYFQKKEIPLVTLCKQCLAFSGYKMPLETSPGLYYKPFTQFISQTYNLTGKVEYPLLLKEIFIAISKNKLVIASVSPEIRQPTLPATKKGGHLVLIVGFDSIKKEIYLHNPSGNSPKSQKYAVIPYKDFKRFFANKGIILSPSNLN